MEHYCSDRELMLWYSGRDICHYEASVPKVTIKMYRWSKKVSYTKCYLLIVPVNQLTLRQNKVHCNQNTLTVIFSHNIYRNKSDSVSKVWVAFHWGEKITIWGQVEFRGTFYQWNIHSPLSSADGLDIILNCTFQWHLWSKIFVHLCKLNKGILNHRSMIVLQVKCRCIYPPSLFFLWSPLINFLLNTTFCSENSVVAYYQKWNMDLLLEHFISSGTGDNSVFPLTTEQESLCKFLFCGS